MPLIPRDRALPRARGPPPALRGCFTRRIGAGAKARIFARTHPRPAARIDRSKREHTNAVDGVLCSGLELRNEAWERPGSCDRCCRRNRLAARQRGRERGIICTQRHPRSCVKPTLRKLIAGGACRLERAALTFLATLPTQRRRRFAMSDPFVDDPAFISKLQIIDRALLATCVKEEIRAGQLDPEEGERRTEEPMLLEETTELRMSFKRASSSPVSRFLAVQRRYSAPGHRPGRNRQPGGHGATPGAPVGQQPHSQDREP